MNLIFFSNFKSYFSPQDFYFPYDSYYAVVYGEAKLVPFLFLLQNYLIKFIWMPQNFQSTNLNFPTLLTEMTYSMDEDSYDSMHRFIWKQNKYHIMYTNLIDMIEINWNKTKHYDFQLQWCHNEPKHPLHIYWQLVSCWGTRLVSFKLC